MPHLCCVFAETILFKIQQRKVRMVGIQTIVHCSNIYFTPDNKKRYRSVNVFTVFGPSLHRGNTLVLQSS